MKYTKEDIVIGLRWRFKNETTIYTITEFYYFQNEERFFADADHVKNCSGSVEMLIDRLNDGTKVIVSTPQNQIPDSYEIF